MVRNTFLGGLMLLGALLPLAPATESLDLLVLDVQFRMLRKWFPRPAPDIAIIGIDHASSEHIAEPFALWHRHLSAVLRALGRAGPTVVGIDIVLPDRSVEAFAPNTDKLLIQGIIDARRSYPLVLALTVDPAGTTRTVYAPFIGAAGADSAGYALFPLDRDRVVRRFDEHIAENGSAVPTFAGQLARKLQRDVSGGYIDYARGPPFEYVPFHRVLEWIHAGDSAAIEHAFRGKPVLLGVLQQFNDRHATPLQLAAWEPDARDVAGVLINAQALRNLLGGGFVQRVSQPWVAAAAALAAGTWLLSSGTLTIVILIIALGSALFVASTWLLAQGWVFPVIGVVAALALGAGLRHLWDTAERLLERRRLREAFSGYVSPSVMDEILSGHLRPELGGTEKFVCVLFSDIRSYTARSESMSAPEVVAFLNRYFDRVVDIIHAHGGAIICFMGDGIMAVFGAAKPLANPCQSGFDAARELIRNATALSAEIVHHGQKPLEVGVGLNAGLAVVGHIGSRDRHDYTVIGDVTNVAARLEGLTKEAGYRLIAASAVVERLEQDPGLVSLGALEIRGHSPVTTHGWDSVHPVQRQAHGHASEGLGLSAPGAGSADAEDSP